MKIIFCDLAYLNKSDFTHPVPLNVGYIVANFIQTNPNEEVEIFKDPHKLFKRLDVLDYDILALSNYDWNYNLNRYVLEYAKNLNPKLICIMGGPNLDSTDDDQIKLVFNHYQYVDFYIAKEGERAFEQLFAELKQVNFMKDKVAFNLLSFNILHYNKSTDNLLRGGQESGFTDLKTLPSPYLTGVMDEFLNDENLVPMIETNRGCPYSCAFCCWGSATQSKIRQFDFETVVKEIEYIAEHTKNTPKTLYVADGNFGLIKRDVAIAKKIMQVKKSTGYPLSIFIYFAKNTDSTVVEIANILDGLVDFNMSKQTLNKDVLENIGRKNISDTEYDKRILELKKVNTNTICELIYGLPGESYQSFIEGARTMSKKGYKLTFYPLGLLKGAEISSKEYCEKYGIKSAFRVLPRYMGYFNDSYIYEYEELAIENNAFSRKDFFQLRLLQYYYFIFKEKFFEPVAKFLAVNNIDLITMIEIILSEADQLPFYVIENITEFNEAAQSEFVDKEEIKPKHSKEEAAQIGNAKALNIYYFCKLISNNKEFLKFRDYLKELLGRLLINSQRKIHDCLNLLLDVSFDRIPNFEDMHIDTVFSYEKWNTEIDFYLNISMNEKVEENSNIKLNFHYFQEMYETLSTNLKESNNTYDAIYKTRMGLISSAYRAYTYEISMLKI